MIHRLMNTITKIYQDLNSNGLVKDKQEFSIYWAKRNQNWLTYTEHKNREGCLEVIINIYNATKEQQRKYEQRKRKIGWLAEDMLVVLKRIQRMIMEHMLDRYGIQSIETTAA